MGKRSKAREIVLQGLYQHDMSGRSLLEICKFDWVKNKNKLPPDVFVYARELLSKIIMHLPELDHCINCYVTQWSVEKLFSIDRNILRLSVYGFLYQRDIPSLVVISEAVNLAHRFGKENSYKLVNALLDTLSKYLKTDCQVNNSLV